MACMILLCVFFSQCFTEGAPKAVVDRCEPKTCTSIFYTQRENIFDLPLTPEVIDHADSRIQKKPRPQPLAV